MTNTNKKIIREAIAEIRTMQSRLAALETAVSSVQDETQESYDNLNEYAQDGERGDKLQAEIDALDDALSEFGEVDLSDLVSALASSLDA